MSVVAIEAKPSVVRRVAERYGVDADKMLATLKATAFRGAGEITNEQLMALLVVADAHGLNPWLKELYAFPSQQGIVPVVGVDGWAKLVNGHPAFDGMEFEQDDAQCTCIIYRKDRSHPTKVTEYLSECKRGTGPWNTHPKRMLRHKALIQAARIAFSFAGIYDPDEAERIVEAESGEINVTPGQEVIPASGKVSPKKLRVVVEGLLDATAKNDGPALLAIWNDLANEQQLFVWNELRSWERSAIKKQLDVAKAAAPAKELEPWAIEAIKTSADPGALETTWRLVQDAYAEADKEVTPDVETVYQDRKAELAA